MLCLSFRGTAVDNKIIVVMEIPSVGHSLVSTFLQSHFKLHPLLNLV